MPKLNPTVLLVIMIGIGFQTAFVKSITMNLIVAGVTLLYLLLAGVKWRYLGVMFEI